MGYSKFRDAGKAPEMADEIDDCAAASDSLKHDELKPQYFIILNWFLDPLATCKNLGIELNLENEEWLLIRQFPFGEVGYDCENGVTWYIHVAHADEAAEFMKSFFEVNQIPHAMSDAMSGILAKESIPCKEAGPAYLYLEGNEASEVAALIQNAGWTFNGTEESPTYCVA